MEGQWAACGPSPNLAGTCTHRGKLNIATAIDRHRVMIKGSVTVQYRGCVDHCCKEQADSRYQDPTGTAAKEETMHSSALSPAYVVTAKDVTLSFTPLHTSGSEDGWIKGWLDVWGQAPRPNGRQGE